MPWAVKNVYKWIRHSNRLTPQLIFSVVLVITIFVLADLGVRAFHYVAVC